MTQASDSDVSTTAINLDGFRRSRHYQGPFVSARPYASGSSMTVASASSWTGDRSIRRTPISVYGGVVVQTGPATVIWRPRSSPVVDRGVSRKPAATRSRLSYHRSRTRPASVSGCSDPVCHRFLADWRAGSRSALPCQAQSCASAARGAGGISLVCAVQTTPFTVGVSIGSRRRHAAQRLDRSRASLMTTVMPDVIATAPGSAFEPSAPPKILAVMSLRPAPTAGDRSPSVNRDSDRTRSWQSEAGSAAYCVPSYAGRDRFDAA